MYSIHEYLEDIIGYPECPDYSDKLIESCDSEKENIRKDFEEYPYDDRMDY